MTRLALLALLIGGAAACGNGSKPAAEQGNSPGKVGDGKTEPDIIVPGAKGGGEGAVGAATGGVGSAAPNPMSVRASNPQFHLKPEEGVLTIAKVEAKAGTAGTAEVKLAPGSGYKIATDFPMKLQLEETAGVKVEKLLLTAGGRNKTQGDASTLTEQAVAFAVKATPEAAGAFEIKGVFSFGICEKDSCHPRTQPITIQVAAN